MNKVPVKEKQRPKYKRKPKQETYEVKQPEIHFFDGIPYILIGWPGFEQVYAVDDKGIITYELTAVLRKKLQEFNHS